MKIDFCTVVHCNTATTLSIYDGTLSSRTPKLRSSATGRRACLVLGAGGTPEANWAVSTRVLTTYLCRCFDTLVLHPVMLDDCGRAHSNCRFEERKNSRQPCAPVRAPRSRR